MRIIVRACRGEFCQLIPIPFMIEASMSRFIAAYYPGFVFTEVVKREAL